LINLSSKNAVKAFESSTFIDRVYQCDFQLEISPEIKAGIYEGTIIVQVCPKFKLNQLKICLLLLFSLGRGGF
jgi:hypothetical protein